MLRFSSQSLNYTSGIPLCYWILHGVGLPCFWKYMKMAAFYFYYCWTATLYLLFLNSKHLLHFHLHTYVYMYISVKINAQGLLFFIQLIPHCLTVFQCFHTTWSEFNNTLPVSITKGIFLLGLLFSTKKKKKSHE